MIDLKKIEENIDILIAIETKEDLLEWIRKNDEQRGKVKNYSIPDVSQRSKLLDFKEWWNNLDDESDDKLYMTEETIDRYLKSNCG